jgi:hypothetical protein
MPLIWLMKDLPYTMLFLFMQGRQRFFLFIFFGGKDNCGSGSRVWPAKRKRLPPIDRPLFIP